MPRFAKVRLNRSRHCAIFAPTRAGKGIFFVVKYLLECRESVICVDPKGENAILTSKHREAMGQRVVRSDPFKVTTQTPDTFNPLDGIDRDSPLLVDDCRSMSNAMVTRTGEEKDPFWNDSAEMFITAMLVATCLYAKGEDRSIQAVRTLLTSPERMSEAKEFLGEMGTDIKKELVHQSEMGSQEVAAALFRRSDGFVLYPHQNNESPQQAQETPQIESPGREM